MLDSSQAWTAARDAIGEWLQIDLGSMQSVAGIVVQARADGLEEWVTQYRVECGANQFKLERVLGEFRGCGHGLSKVQALFPIPVTARYVRVFPLAWHGRASMRAGVLTFDTTGPGWDCPSCTFKNGFGISICTVCDHERLEASDEKYMENLRRQLRDAVELLRECRSVLAWTYVWAFFEADETQRRLFEFVQKDLEVKTEQLSYMIENHTTAKVVQDLAKLIDYVSALRGYLDHMKEYTTLGTDRAMH